MGKNVDFMTLVTSVKKKTLATKMCGHQRRNINVETAVTFDKETRLKQSQATEPFGAAKDDVSFGERIVELLDVLE